MGDVCNKLLSIFIVFLIFLAGTVLPYPVHPHFSSRRLLNEGEHSALEVRKQPPKAKKIKHEMKMFGDVRTDNYYWLRDDSRTDPQVLAYLQEENNYTDFVMSGTKHLQDQIFAEINGRIKENDISTPRRRGPYYYYERYYYERSTTVIAYTKYCRRLAPNNGDQPTVYDVMPTGPESLPEHVILDTRLKAQGHSQYSIGSFKVSPNHKLVAYTEDTKGGEIYKSYVIDADPNAESGNPIGKALVGLTYSVVWADNEALLYITTDANLRSEKVWLHKIGEEQSSELCIYHEKDVTFSVYIEASRSQKYVFVGSKSTTTSFIFYFDIANPQYEIIPLTPRVDGIYTIADHRGTHFFIARTSDDFQKTELLACPVVNVSATTIIVPPKESATFKDFQLFSDHLVVYVRENGLPIVNVYKLPPVGAPILTLQRPQAVVFMDPVYSMYSPASQNFDSSILRLTFSSMKTPETVFDYDMNTRVSVIKKMDTVLGGFNSSNYVTQRLWATAPDGIQVPMSIAYRKDLMKLDGSNPLVLFGYGAYEVSSDPSFSASILSLLDRGFIFVIAHVRGGGELGRQWYKNGKSLKKKNTFTDFIACAEFLIEMKYTTKEKLVIDSSWEGGLLIGAVINMRPDLFKVAILEVPFVDILTTMLDPTIPRTKSDWEEWGDPRKEEFYYYMKSYSPVDNVSAQKYPSILVTATLNEQFILYSEAAKLVAKLRDLKTNDNMMLLKCELSDLQLATSTRLDWNKQDAFVITFTLKALNMAS